MRNHLLGLTTAALAVGTLSLGLPTPAQAVGGIDGGNISNFGDVPTSVDVAAFGSGDALAAWTKPVVGGSRVYAAIATDGVWGAPKPVTAAAVTNAHDVRALANDSGDLAVVWNQTTGGEHKVRGSRYLANGTWDGSTLLSASTDISQIDSIDAGMDGSGRIHVAFDTEHGGADRVQTSVWAEGGSPIVDNFDFHTFDPSIDVNPAGDVLLSYYDNDSGQDAIMVSRRNAAVGWLGPKQVPWAGDTSNRTRAELADDGRGAVLMGGVEDAKTRALVVRVGADGSLGNIELVSPAGVGTSSRDLSVSPNGTMEASWTAFENGNTYVIRAAVAKPGKDFGPASLAEPKTITSQPHRALISDRGAQVVVHNDADRLTLRHRTNPALLFGEYDAGATDGAFAADMDRDGNVVAAGIVEDGLNSYVEADFLDVAGPTARITAPGARATSPTFDVAWSVTDSLSGVKSTDVLARSAAWNGGFGAQQVIANNVTTDGQAFAGQFGSTHCFQAQGVDKAGNLGFRSEEHCVTVPLDDTALSGGKWQRIARAGAFNDTATTTRKKGRKLVLPGVRARGIDLIVGKAKKGGKVKVYWNGKVVRTVSLKGKGSQVTVPVADFGSVQNGTLKIKVVSKNGRKVAIDGVVVTK